MNETRKQMFSMCIAVPFIQWGCVMYRCITLIPQYEFDSLLEHVFIVLGVDWRLSGLCDRQFLHGGQSELHRCVESSPARRSVCCAACGAMTYQATAGATATSCAGVVSGCRRSVCLCVCVCVDMCFASISIVRDLQPARARVHRAWRPLARVWAALPALSSRRAVSAAQVRRHRLVVVVCLK